MKILTWVLQIILAAFFAMAGLTKVTTPVPDLVETMPWVQAFPTWAVPVIGGLEIAAAVGLIVPAALAAFNILGGFEVLTPLAAAGLTIIMVGAIITHATRGEWAAVPMNLVVLVIAAFVAWHRFRLLNQRDGETKTETTAAATT